MKKRVIAIEELRELVRTIIYTSYVDGEKPVSCIFVADKGSGKSEILNKFKMFDNLAYFTDITYVGLIDLLERNENIQHIVIPDFLKIVMKKKSTSENIISCLNALMEEGLGKISFFNKTYDFKDRRCGLLTATTSDSFLKNQKQWDSIGFISRMLVVSYSYSNGTKADIFDYIFNRKYLKEKLTKEKMPKKKSKIILPLDLAKQLKDKDTDFRKQKQLQVLSMARALVHGRKEVIQKDINEVNSMKKFINLLFHEI
jgi:hypothetical protein